MVRVGSGSQLKEVLVKLVLGAVEVSDVSVSLPVSSRHHLSAVLAIKEVVSFVCELLQNARSSRFW